MARHKKDIPINLGISRTTHLGQGKIYTALFFGLKTYLFKSPSVWHETITSGEIELNSARIMVKYNMFVYICLFICIYIYTCNYYIWLVYIDSIDLYTHFIYLADL